jgi:hypothetical protein
MKKAGDLLSGILDEKIMNRAKSYSKLFLFWISITQKNGIAAAADHSQLLDIQRGILIIEADHPGWIQILQTKEHLLLAELQHGFPELEITGLSFKLSRGPFKNEDTSSAADTADEASSDYAESGEAHAEAPADTVNADPYKTIKDEKFRETLKNLEKSVIENNTGKKKK